MVEIAGHIIQKHHPNQSSTMPHFRFFKPYGTLSQFVNNGVQKKRHTLIGDFGSFPDGTMAVGRLDRDSEGLLLLTTDGKWSSQMTSKGIEKEYWVQVDGIPTEEQLATLAKGVDITVKKELYTTLPCTIRKIPTPNLPPRAKAIRDERHGPTTWLSITLREGKFRQVRKMTAKIGTPTLRLVRFRVGDYTLEGLEPGDSKIIEKSST